MYDPGPVIGGRIGEKAPFLYNHSVLSPLKGLDEYRFDGAVMKTHVEKYGLRVGWCLLISIASLADTSSLALRSALAPVNIAVSLLNISI